MPTKKKRKPKTREYREKLLEDVGLTDRRMAQAIKDGIESDNPTLQAKSLEMAGEWKGFKEIDKRGDEIEHLPLANVALADLKRLCNRCSYCKHRQFEPLRGKAAAALEQPGEAPLESAGEIPAAVPGLGDFPYVELPGDNHKQGDIIHIPVPESAVVPSESAFPVLKNEQTPQEKTD